MAVITLPFIFYFALLNLYMLLYFFKYNKVPLIKGVSVATWIDV